MDKHIVRSGELYHKTSGTVSAGSLRWAVLMRESIQGPKRLELYRTYADYTSTTLPATFVLNLSDMLHVERDLDSGSPPETTIPSLYSSYNHHWDKRHDLGSSVEPSPPRHQFTITTEKGVHVFCTRSSSESSSWVGKLNELLHGPPEQGVEYEFPVQLLPTPFSRSLALHSSHVLKVSESDVRIYDATGTTPTSFVCPLGSIEKVDHTASHVSSPGSVSLHCSNVCGTAAATGGGIIAMSTPSSANISRILNHRRMSAAPPPPLHRDTVSPSLDSQLHSLIAPHQHHHRVGSQKLHPSTSRRTFSSPSPTNAPVPSCGQSWHTAHAQVSVVKSLPPASVFGSLKQTKLKDLSSSSSDSDEDGDDETVHVSAGQLERIASRRKTSGGDFESVASWVRHKSVSLWDRGTSGFSRISSSPNISNQNRRQDLSSHISTDSHLAGEHATSLVSTGTERQSSKRKFAVSGHQLLRRSSSLGNSLDRDQASYVKLSPLGADNKRKGDAPGSQDSLCSNNMYGGGSRYLPTSLTNRNEDSNSEQQATTDPAEHHYESVKELTRQPTSIDLDYDYVKDRILGVRGLPVHQPAASSSSDEEDNYYY